MITKSDWQDVHDELIAENRQRLGEPPTDDEILAYMGGELSPEEEARVRALLVCYPELARVVAAPFPADDPKPGEPGYLSPSDVNRSWQSFRKRIGRDEPQGPRWLQFRPMWGAFAAAVLAVVVGALLWNARSGVRQPVNAVAWEEQELILGGARGAGDEFVPLTVRGEKVALKLPLIRQPEFAGYRLELLDVSGPEPRLVYDTTTVRMTEDVAVLAIVDWKDLTPGGRYQFVLYGVDGGREQQLGTYSFRVPAS
ncbi:MAG TPA: hypothetical protein VEK57_20700 [Thermoanaerobaculia bacterium]|nr:hypothetical protein [Thermoanaerobaculia bacterium]